MKERKFVKLKVDMYEDTKFKIIDTMPKRDLINYIWTRLLTLAGKVNLAGELYLSKNIPYTVETLAIEFNRSAIEVELALRTFQDLEMVEFTADNVYKIKNFAKHQNIKVEEKVIENLENEIITTESAHIDIPQIQDISIKAKNQITKEEVMIIKNHDSEKIKAEPSPANISPLLNKKKRNKTSTKNRKGVNDIEMLEEESLITIYDGFNAIPFVEGDKVVASWTCCT
ncbi:hypothetical protein psyc5s11_50650 [Clostridium gelidum]|uniref:Phage replisome organiser N-terminal domain-containing protein n=1 Tax=Clostridium gelidum TaxID=704125 RepID=A0ABN6J6J3_9CLOT|nr:phage replisome organizer N-terminal domain-containing protein [Clostridium gelidum]BCZ48998.1 hypothetical protein psyc5s11_50650 [Clostridium gelidum]